MTTFITPMAPDPKDIEIAVLRSELSTLRESYDLLRKA
jgi:hypothetical protein